MTTKARIAEEALDLFSIKGFKGTSVKNIADAVGIKDSSLYKHFSGKQEIFDTIVLEMKSRMAGLAERMKLPEEEDYTKSAQAYGAMSLEDLLLLSRRIFLFYLKDPFMSRFWRMANMEQYQNTEVYGIFRQIFMEDSIFYQAALFEEMMNQGIFVKADPAAVAMNFYTPIFFLLSKYNGREEGEEEALRVLENQVREFYRIYRVKNQD